MSDEWLDYAVPNSWHWITDGKEVWFGGYEGKENRCGYRFIPLGPKPKPPPERFPASKTVSCKQTANIRFEHAWIANVFCDGMFEAGAVFDTKEQAIQWVHDKYQLEPTIKPVQP